MVQSIARIKIKGKHFEIMVDVDKALELKAGKQVNVQEIIEVDRIFSDTRKGFQATDTDLEECFGTTEIAGIVDKIIKHGEIVLPLEYKRKELEGKEKQVVDFLARNAIDPNTGRPHSAERIKSAIDQAGIKIDSKPISEQIKGIIDKLRVVLPISIESKKLKIVIPALHTGKVYGILQIYKDKESWLGNGDLEVVVSIPVGLQSEFYDKLNSFTHGSAITEEVKE